MTLNEILNAVNQLSTTGELLAINKLTISRLKQVQAVNCAVAIGDFSVGQAVEWSSSKFGMVITGKVVRIKLKNVLVDYGSNRLMNVPASMLRPATKLLPGTVVTASQMHAASNAGIGKMVSQMSAGQKAAMTRKLRAAAKGGTVNPGAKL
jgi:hypothetical protein